MTTSTWEPGSIVAMLGKHEISKLIAWCSDGLYSHIGIVVDGGSFIEATTAGVVETSIKKRCPAIGQSPLHGFFSARTVDGGPLTANQSAALSAAARDYVGQKYDTGVLAQLGMVVLVKRRIPEGAAECQARKLIDFALDQLVRGDREKLTCSELVYRVFAEAKVTPSLRLPLGNPPRLNQPFPEVDWAAFACEVAEIYFPGSCDFERNLSSQSPEDISAERLLQRIDEVAAQLDLAPGVAESSLPMSRLVSPNPKVVQIPDLISSPRFAQADMPPCP